MGLRALLIALGSALLITVSACADSETEVLPTEPPGSPPAATIAAPLREKVGPPLPSDPESVPIFSPLHERCSMTDVEPKVRQYLRENWAELAAKPLVSVDIFNCFPELDQILLTLHIMPPPFVPPEPCQVLFRQRIAGEQVEIPGECSGPDSLEFVKIPYAAVP